MLTKEEKKDFDEVLQEYIKNPAWKKEYENAPSQECKEYLNYTYYDSKYYESGENEDRLDEMKRYFEDRLGVKDWEYLKSSAGNSPFVYYCKKKIEGLSNKS